LWLPAHAISSADRTLLREFQVFTLNGFPYGDFHGERVKYSVYEPNWCDPRRVEYTIELAKLLCEVSCVDEPTISTLPIGWKADLELAAKNLFHVAEELSRLDKKIMLCLEPEPGCVLESAADVVKFFEGPLARYDQQLIRRHIGVCWDTC